MAQNYPCAIPCKVTKDNKPKEHERALGLLIT
jgi:hypothetical protein